MLGLTLSVCGWTVEIVIVSLCSSQSVTAVFTFGRGIEGRFNYFQGPLVTFRDSSLG